VGRKSARFINPIKSAHPRENPVRIYHTPPKSLKPLEAVDLDKATGIKIILDLLTKIFDSQYESHLDREKAKSFLIKSNVFDFGPLPANTKGGFFLQTLKAAGSTTIQDTSCSVGEASPNLNSNWDVAANAQRIISSYINYKEGTLPDRLYYTERDGKANIQHIAKEIARTLSPEGIAFIDLGSFEASNDPQKSLVNIFNRLRLNTTPAATLTKNQKDSHLLLVTKMNINYVLPLLKEDIQRTRS
jgi:hypothetical protein